MRKSLAHLLHTHTIGNIFFSFFVLGFLFLVLSCNMTWNENLSEWLESNIQGYRERPPHGAFFVSQTGSDENGNGSRVKPFFSLSSALQKMNDENLEYTIFIQGVVNGKVTINDDVKAKKVMIKGDGSLGSCCISSTSASCLVVEKDLVLENLTVSQSSGSAIILKNGNLLLNDVVVTNFGTRESTSSGILFENENKASLIVSGSKSCISNFGTGVTMTGAHNDSVFVMEDGTIKNTECAVISSANFTMRGGVICDNKNGAAQCSGVKVTSGTFTMEGGMIGEKKVYQNSSIDCTPTNDKYSNYIGVEVLKNASFYMTGGLISYNYSFGVKGNQNANITITGGEIEWNFKGVDVQTKLRIGDKARIGYYYSDNGSLMSVDSRTCFLSNNAVIEIMSNLIYEKVCGIKGGSSSSAIITVEEGSRVNLSEMIKKFLIEDNGQSNTNENEIKRLTDDGKYETLCKVSQTFESDRRVVTVSKIANFLKQSDSIYRVNCRGFYYASERIELKNYSSDEIKIEIPYEKSSSGDGLEKDKTVSVVISYLLESGYSEEYASCGLPGSS